MRLTSLALALSALLAPEPTPAPSAPAAPSPSPWINEFHYDNAGIDAGEFVEIAGAAGTSLSGWRVLGYDAKKGKLYKTVSLSGTIPDQQAQRGALAFAFDAMQDGSPDGLALVDAAGALIEFLSYEGVFKATNGPAMGKTSVDVGVTEPGTTPVGSSLQRGGSGTSAGDFTWKPSAPQTPGLPNLGQIFGAPDTTPPAAPTGLTAVGGNAQVSLDWTDNVEPDLAGYHVHRGTTSGGPYTQLTASPLATSAYVDLAATNGTTWRYVVTAVDVAGNPSAPSTEASATPQAPAPPGALHVAQIVALPVPQGPVNERGRALVTVVDGQGAPVASAQVTAAFTGDVTGTLTAATGADGVATLTTSTKAAAPIAFGFCVLSVTHALLVHDPALDVVTCETWPEESDGAGTEYFVATDGNDTNSGKTIALPWKTLAHALPLLKAGDTLHVRGGAYAESELAIGAAGTASAPITIRAFPSEHPVIDGAYPDFTTAGNQAWEQVDAAKSIWRSVKTYPGADEVYGYFGPGDGGWRLVPYEDYGPLSTDNEDYAATPPYSYIGPGVFWNAADSRIYYRSKHGRYEIADGIDVPANLDPRQTPLFIFPKGELLDVQASAAYLVIEGLDLRHRPSAIRIKSGAHHVTVRDCSLRGGRYHALVQTGAHDLVFDQVVVADSFPSWVAWSDVKQPSSAPPGHLLQGAAILLSDAVDRVEISHCTLTGGFDAIDATGAPSHLRVHDCTFDARDDVLQLGTAGWAVEFDHNRTLRAHSGGPSWNGSGGPPAGQAGTVYVHHNVLDTSQPQRYGRADPLGLLGSKFQGPKGDGFATGRTFGAHSKDAATGPAPWKIYHNTALVNADVESGGAGQAYELPQHDPAAPHEVFNNVFVQLGDQWLLRDARVDDGSQIHDGNLYWAPNRGPGMDLLEDLWLGNDDVDFASLAALIGSGAWSATQLAYPPGWESHGVEADPQLDAQLHPSATGPAASGAVDLSAKGWPGLAGETFRGALPPGP